MTQGKPDQVILWDLMGTLLKGKNIDQGLAEVILQSSEIPNLECVHVLCTSDEMTKLNPTEYLSPIIRPLHISNVIFSNGWIRNLNRDNQISGKDYFLKSHSDTYQKIADLYGVNVEDITLVDDLNKNLVAAQEAGCQIFNAKAFNPAMWIKPAANKKPSTLEIFKGEMLEEASIPVLLNKFLRDRAEAKKAPKLS